MCSSSSSHSHTTIPYFRIRTFYDPATTGENLPEDDFEIVIATDDYQITYERQLIHVVFYEQNLTQTACWEEAGKLRTFVRELSKNSTIQIPARVKLRFFNDLTALVECLLNAKDSLHRRWLTYTREKKKRRTIASRLGAMMQRFLDVMFNTEKNETAKNERDERRDERRDDQSGESGSSNGGNGGNSPKPMSPKPKPINPFSTPAAIDIQDHDHRILDRIINGDDIDRDGSSAKACLSGDYFLVDFTDETNGGASQWISEQIQQSPYVDRFSKADMGSNMNNEQFNPPHMAEDPAQQMIMQLWESENDRLRRAVEAQKQAEAAARVKLEQVYQDMVKLQRKQIADAIRRASRMAKVNQSQHGKKSGQGGVGGIGGKLNQEA